MAWVNSWNFFSCPQNSDTYITRQIQSKLQNPCKYEGRTESHEQQFFVK